MKRKNHLEKNLHFFFEVKHVKPFFLECSQSTIKLTRTFFWFFFCKMESFPCFFPGLLEEFSKDKIQRYVVHPTFHDPEVFLGGRITHVHRVE